MTEDSLKKRYAIKLLANAITAIIGAIIMAIVPKSLGPVSYGQFVYLQKFFTELISFFDMGTSTALFTKLSAKHTRTELISFYFFYALGVLAITFLFVHLVYKFDYHQKLLPSIPYQYIYMGLLFVFFTWITQIFIIISDAYALTVSVELVKIGHRIISLLLLLYFVHFTLFQLTSYFFYNYIVLFSFLLLMTWLFYKKRILRKEILSLNFNFSKLLKEFIQYCHPLVIYNIMGILVSLFDIWLLQTMAGSKQMAFYGLSYGLATMCFLFTSAMTPIIMREFSKSYEQKDLETMQKLFYRYIPMLYSIAAYFSVFISVQSENVLVIFADEKFKDAYLVLVIMAFYPIHQTYGQLSGSIFYATGQTKRIRNIALLMQPFGMFLTILFVYFMKYEAIGLVYKMIISQLITVNIQLYFNAKFLGMTLRYFIWHQIYSLIFFILLAFTSSNLVIMNNPLYSFIVSGFIYTIFVIIFVYIFPQVFATRRDEIKGVLIKVLNVTQK